jgi:tungstate transport system ATP-binding protein
MKSPLLRFEDLGISLGGRPLFRIPELTLDEGSCTLLTGPNGCGKTTLLKIIAGLKAPDTGQVTYRNVRLPWRKATRRYRAEVVYVHQDPYMFDASVADNVAHGLRAAKTPPSQVTTKVSQALKWAGLQHLAERNAKQLSGGEKQRVALTRARVLSPRVLLLDEPTANLDRDAREQTHRLIARLSTDGLAVVVSSHQHEAYDAIGARHLYFRNGRLHLEPRDEEKTSAPNVPSNVTPFRRR